MDPTLNFENLINQMKLLMSGDVSKIRYIEQKALEHLKWKNVLLELSTTTTPMPTSSDVPIPEDDVDLFVEERNVSYFLKNYESSEE